MNAVKTAGSNLAKFGSAAGGLVVGSMLMKRVPAFGPPIVQKLLPGSVGMILAYFLAKKFGNEYVKNAAMGLGLAGFVDVVKKFTDGKTGLLATVNQSLPALSGLGYVQNYGEYPPTYFGKPTGMGNVDQNAFSLQGTDQEAFSLTGAMFGMN
jgi:hypothetical protein